MGYFDYMKQLLQPLRLYDLDEGYGASELRVLGAELDEVFDELEAAERESIVSTAQDEGLSAYEEILPYVPAYLTPEDRRRAIEALIRIDGASFTPEDMQNSIYGCGIAAEVSETGETNRVEVRFPQNRGIPEGIEALKVRIESILPCHIGVDYIYLFPSWSDMEKMFPTWDELENAHLTWEEIERLEV